MKIESEQTTSCIPITEHSGKSKAMETEYRDGQEHGAGGVNSNSGAQIMSRQGNSSLCCYSREHGSLHVCAGC